MARKKKKNSRANGSGVGKNIEKNSGDGFFFFYRLFVSARAPYASRPATIAILALERPKVFPSFLSVFRSRKYVSFPPEIRTRSVIFRRLDDARFATHYATSGRLSAPFSRVGRRVLATTTLASPNEIIRTSKRSCDRAAESKTGNISAPGPGRSRICYMGFSVSRPCPLPLEKKTI